MILNKLSKELAEQTRQRMYTSLLASLYKNEFELLDKNTKEFATKKWIYLRTIKLPNIISYKEKNNEGVEEDKKLNCSKSKFKDISKFVEKHNWEVSYTNLLTLSDKNWRVLKQIDERFFTQTK